MSQHDMVIDNGPGINVRLDINQALQALGGAGARHGGAGPDISLPDMGGSTTGLGKSATPANTAWLADGKLDVATGGGVPVGGAAGAILVKKFRRRWRHDLAVDGGIPTDDRRDDHRQSNGKRHSKCRRSNRRRRRSFNAMSRRAHNADLLRQRRRRASMVLGRIASGIWQITISPAAVQSL